MKTGLMYGIILAVLGAIGAAVNYFTGDYAAGLNGQTGSGLSTVVSLVMLVLTVVLLLLAGRAASNQTGKVGSGAVSGLVAGIVAGIIGAAITVALLVTTPITQEPASVANQFTLEQYASLVKTAGIVAAVVGVLVDAGIGAGIGALGGLIGRSSYQKAHPPMMPGAYPPGGYPQQPMQ